MKKRAICAVAITGFIGTSAFAADMGVPAAPPPAPVWNWTGWYVGLNAGASFGSVKTDFNVAPFTVTTGVPTTETFPGFGGSNREYPDGFMGGGQIGYNWQYSPLIVVGLEADFQGAVEKDSNNFFVSSNGSLQPPDTATAVLNYATKIDWFGTVRGRIGYVWGNGQVLSYLTAGLAYGRVELEGTGSGTITGTGASPPSILFSLGQGISHSQINTGWVVGYGTEGRLGNSNWTLKIESLYMGLGTLDTTGAPGVRIGPCTGVTCAALLPITATGGQVTTHTRFNDGILRLGLNYKFY